MANVNKSGLVNCTTDAPDTITQTELDAGVNWNITANSGFKFDTAPRIRALDFSGSSYFYDMVLDATQTVANYTGVFYKAATSGFYLNGSAIEDVPEFKEYGSINPYVVTEDNLKEFANARFAQQTPEGGVLVDLGSFVHSIKKVYYPLEKANVTDLWAGSTNTLIQVEALDKDEVILTFNDVLIPTKNNNITDLNSEIKVFLPFVGFTVISSEYIGTLIKIEYRINVINSIAVVNIYSNDILIEVIECNPFKDIIYRKNDLVEGTIGSLESDASYLYGLKPYIILKWYQSNDEALFNSDLKRGVINNSIGWSRFENVDNLNTVNMLHEEVLQIKQKLNDGVLIV